MATITVAFGAHLTQIADTMEEVVSVIRVATL
jgi:hypothetical protein